MKKLNRYAPAWAGGMLLSLASAAMAQPAAAPAAAAERESLESLRETTLSLIEVLVANGTLTREKADQLLADARRRAAARIPAGEWGSPPPAPAAAATTPVTRVPFVPQVVRDQIRNELREEIVARARAERWGVPNATAEWTDRILVSGDLRVRGQADLYDDQNLSPLDFVTGAAASLATRAPDFASATPVGLPTANTLVDRNRSRVRARLGVLSRVNDWVTGGLRLATGSATDRVSTNQTLGQNFNKYSFLVDQAYVRLTPWDWVSASAGRIPNPWFSTDLVWNDSLSFEGAALTVRRPELGSPTLLPFATVGYFPVRESAPPRRGRGLLGAQVGLQWEASELTRVRVGYARYHFRYFEGQIDGDYSAVTGPGASYGQYEYEAGLPGIPRAAETIMLERDMRLVQLTGGRYHAAMITCRDSLEVIRRAKQAGLPVTAGVSINHLTLNEMDIGGYRTFLKLRPPLRSEEDRLAMVEALAEGLVDLIVSDHNPQDVETKRLTFAECEPGAIGLETMLSAGLQLVEAGLISLQRLLEAMSAAPARLAGLETGRMARGTPADLIVLDRDYPWVVDAAGLRSKCKNTPFDEARLSGKVFATLVAGRVVHRLT